MNRLKFLVFKPAQVKCFECKVEGPSRVVASAVPTFLLMFLLLIALAWLTGFLQLPIQRPFVLGSWFGPQYTPFVLIFWTIVVLSMLFNPKAHRCGACGSPYIKAK